MFLIIHTADKEKIFLALVQKNKVIKKSHFKARFRQAEKLLPRIDKLFANTKHKLSQIKGIMVVSGPGPFSALRIGIATANAIGWSLGIPVAGITLEEFKDNDELTLAAEKKVRNAKAGDSVMPHYGKEPNITKPKTNQS